MSFPRTRESMRILLLGKTGLLGSALFNGLRNIHAVSAPNHKECDATNPKQLRATFQSVNPEIVINATGYTAVDQAESDRDLCFRLNVDAVRYLAELAKSFDIPLLHFSTDYIFDGKNRDGYKESNVPHPISVYGKSKAQSEKIITSLKKYYLIRTSWLYGPNGKNFVDSVLKKAEQGEVLRVVNDQKGCPTLTLDLAQAVLRLLSGAPYGIYHIVNDGETTWFEFSQEIFKILGVPQKIIPITSGELSRPAMRPQNSVLINMKFPKLRNWKTALADYLQSKQLIL